MFSPFILFCSFAQIHPLLIRLITFSPAEPQKTTPFMTAPTTLVTSGVAACPLEVCEWPPQFTYLIFFGYNVCLGEVLFQELASREWACLLWVDRRWRASPQVGDWEPAVPEEKYISLS